MSCISKAFRTGIRAPPSCSAKAIARGAGSRSAHLPTSAVGRSSLSRACARCCAAASPWPRPRTRCRSSAPCRTAMSPPSSAASAPSACPSCSPNARAARPVGAAGRRCRDLVLAMLVDRLIAPSSKLATVRALDADTAASSLGEVLGLGVVQEREVYAALDWLLAQQERRERALAKRHLGEGTLVLYDVSSSYLEGRKCELAHFGHSRDHRKDKLQIVYGLLCNRDGCPIAIQVFDGNTADPGTLADQVAKVKQRFALARVVFVGDRGLVTAARIREDLQPAGLDWITALRTPSIQQLVEGGPLQLSLFDER